MELARPAEFKMTCDNRRVAVAILANYDCNLVATKQLKLACARMLVEKRYYGAALDALHVYLLDYPGDPDGLLLLAALEDLLPRWLRSINILESLSARYPLNAQIRLSLHDSFFPHSSYTQLMRQLQGQGDLRLCKCILHKAVDAVAQL